MSHISAELFGYLRELRTNNERSWFEANRERYETAVREPLLRFVRDFETPLSEISPSMLAIAKKRGGSLFRIHRDVRFSRDKSPYKTWAALQFRHEDGRDVHAPGFYLHLAPGEVFAGAGVWRPGRRELGAIRDRIVERPDAWRTVRDTVSGRGWTLAGDSLKRGPRGYDREHPLIEDLCRKDFVVTRPLTEDEVTRPGFLGDFAAMCAQTVPLMRFLARAVDLEF
ncbi:MAG: TIGR02453 family protein [Gemmatimonadales bacterium]|jgi:uncharacterized protein (TIGR02453 family)